MKAILTSVVTLLLLAIPPATFGKGYGPFPVLGGANFPVTASVFSSIAVGQYGFGPYTLGYFLDTDGDATAEFSDVADAIGSEDGIGTLTGAYVSPSDASVIYLLYTPTNGGGFSILTLRRTGDAWTRVGNALRYPSALGEYATASWNVVKARKNFPYFQSSWTNIVSLRRLANGTDAVLVTAIRLFGNHIRSRFALLVDGADGDGIADEWSTVQEFPDLEAMAVDEYGGVIARHSTVLSGPVDSTDYFVRLLPKTGDSSGAAETPTELDESSRVDVESRGRGASCWGDIDYGTARFFFGPGTGTINLNSYGTPITGTIRAFEDLNVGIIPWDDDQVLLDPSGTPFAVANDPQSQIGVIRWVDRNFDSIVGNRGDKPYEAFPVFYEKEIPNPYLLNASVAKIDQIPLEHESVGLRFQDYGDYGTGHSFKFRFSGQDYESVWVSANGLVSFVGPVAGDSTVHGLEQLAGVIAPAWSNDWDTSGARVYAGYSPADLSFRDGKPVYTFAIEWRGLRDRTWETGRSFSMRLLLYSDGTFRTDYGAIDEVTGTPFVVGYSAPGSSSSSIAVNPAEHSWGDEPAGTGEERAAAMEFTSTNALGHIESRWLGYPERLEGPGQLPVVTGLKLAKGKLTFSAASSNVEAGARLVVDGAESFALKKNAAGTKWVVGKKVRSTPSSVSIAAALSGGGHSVVVVNPDGTTSAPATVAQ